MSEQINVSGPMYRPSHATTQGVDPKMLRMLYFAGFGGVAILVGVAAYSLMGHSHGDAVPIVQADQRPIKVKPENPGGMAVVPEEAQIDPNNSHLAPGTEEPNPRALLAMQGPSRGGLQPVVAPAPRPKSLTVQLSAAKTEAAARATWDRLAKRMPELLGQRPALFQKVNQPGPTPWRLRTNGFADPAQAKSFCDKVKAKGGQCAVVDS
jgi:hypothetical protein